MDCQSGSADPAAGDFAMGSIALLVPKHGKRGHRSRFGRFKVWNVQPSTFNFQRSTLRTPHCAVGAFKVWRVQGLERSTFNLQPSTFNTPHSALRIPKFPAMGSIAPLVPKHGKRGHRSTFGRLVRLTCHAVAKRRREARLRFGTFNLQLSTFNLQRIPRRGRFQCLEGLRFGTFNVQRSTFNLQRSTFNTPHSTLLTPCPPRACRISRAAKRENASAGPSAGSTPPST